MAIQVTELSDLRTYPSHTLFRAALISPQGVAGMRRNTRRAGKEEIRGFGQSLASFAPWRGKNYEGDEGDLTYESKLMDGDKFIKNKDLNPDNRT